MGEYLFSCCKSYKHQKNTKTSHLDFTGQETYYPKSQSCLPGDIP